MTAKRAWIALLLIPTLVVPLSGCTSECIAGPPVTARGILDAPQSGGSGGYALDVLILDGPNGEPLAGAGVVVYYGDERATSWTGPRVDVTSDRVVVDPGAEARTVESKTTVRVMTGADGIARARVPNDRIVGVVAAKDGHTEEWIPALATGNNATGMVRMPLYREQVVLDMDAVWAAPGAGSTGTVTASDYAWDPQVVPFGASDEANRGYAARIVELKVSLTWSNGPMGTGDLAIGVGPDEDGPTLFHDDGNNAALGAQTETATFQLADLLEHGILYAPSVQLGAASDLGFVAPFGMPYTMHVEARFDREIAERATACGVYRGSRDDNDGNGASVPGLGAVAVVVGVATLALVRRRA